jgi:hypothetical protein
MGASMSNVDTINSIVLFALEAEIGKAVAALFDRYRGDKAAAAAELNDIIRRGLELTELVKEATTDEPPQISVIPLQATFQSLLRSALTVTGRLTSFSEQRVQDELLVAVVKKLHDAAPDNPVFAEMAAACTNPETAFNDLHALGHNELLDQVRAAARRIFEETRTLNSPCLETFADLIN